ncbi:MAG: hypothetical protein KC561_08945 [Myxococcales bacterium]|nr:hypothetical protein [Myxococcales bacterium]
MRWLPVLTLLLMGCSDNAPNTADRDAGDASNPALRVDLGTDTSDTSYDAGTDADPLDAAAESLGTICEAACEVIPGAGHPDWACGSESQSRTYCLDECAYTVSELELDCARCTASQINWDAGCNEWECLCAIWFSRSGCEDVCRE